MENPTITIIYTEDHTFLSKRKWDSYKEIIQEHPNYIANLTFHDLDSALEFMIDDWGIKENAIQQIKVFYDSSDTELYNLVKD